MCTCNFKTENFDFLNYINLSEEQSRIIWEGRNHPEVRKWMTNSESFGFDVHQNFIEKLKQSCDKSFWAVIYHDKIIGSVCLNPYDRIKREGESGRYLLPEYIGKGLGLQIAKEFINYIIRHGIVNRIYSKTRIDNLRNQHINLKLGFQIYFRDAEYVYMELLSNTIVDEK